MKIPLRQRIALIVRPAANLLGLHTRMTNRVVGRFRIGSDLHVLRGCALGAMLVLAAANCADPSTTTKAALPLNDVLARVKVDPDAIVLAVGDSMEIDVSAQNIFGEPLPIEMGAPVVWKTSAPRKISVDSNGLLRALSATDPDESINITATWTHKGVTLTGTVSATVTETRQPIAAIRIISSDSARAGWTARLETGLASGMGVYTVDANETPIGLQKIPLTVHDSIPSGAVLLLYYGRLGITLGIGQYQVTGHVIGPFWIYAQATVYGVPMRDSIQFTGLYPVTGAISIAQDSASNAIISAMSGEEVFVQPCGLVRFQNTTKIPLDIVFDDSTAAAKCVPTDQDGNILNLTPNQTVTRKFPAVGSVRWTVRDPSTGTLLTRLSGQITMKVP